MRQRLVAKRDDYGRATGMYFSAVLPGDHRKTPSSLLTVQQFIRGLQIYTNYIEPYTSTVVRILSRSVSFFCSGSPVVERTPSRRMRRLCHIQTTSYDQFPRRRSRAFAHLYTFAVHYSSSHENSPSMARATRGQYIVALAATNDRNQNRHKLYYLNIVWNSPSPGC